MVTKDEVKNLLYVLDNEYTGVLSGDEEKDRLKLATWYAKLKEFNFEECQKAIFKLLDNKIYGKPNISDLMEILNYNGENEVTEIIETAKNIYLSSGTDNLMEYLRKYDLHYYVDSYTLRTMAMTKIDAYLKSVKYAILNNPSEVKILVEKRKEYRLEFEKQQQLLESGKLNE